MEWKSDCAVQCIDTFFSFTFSSFLDVLIRCSNRANVNIVLDVLVRAYLHRLYLPANKNYVRIIVSGMHCIHYNNNGNKIIFIVTAVFMYRKCHSFRLYLYVISSQISILYQSSMFKANAFRFYGSESN